MRIGIDIDDTISKTFEKVVGYALEYTKEYINPNFQIEDDGKVFTNLGYKEMFHWTDEQDAEFWKKYDFAKIIFEVECKENAAEVISRLYENNEIYIITARNKKVDENIEMITKKWLEENKIKYHHIYMNAREKISYCIDNKIDLFIDDTYYHCKKLKDNNIQIFMMKSEMNKNIQDDSIPVFHNWKEIDEKLKDI